MDTPSGQDQFSALNFVANITVFHTCYQVHFVNYEYWTGSLVPNSCCSPEGLIAMADQALYIAKTKGRNTYWLYNDPIPVFTGKCT